MMPSGPTAVPHLSTTPPQMPMLGSPMPAPEPEASPLMGARGARFDEMFLRMMVAHHEDAVALAKTELASGVNAPARQLARTIRDQQTAEIARMRQLLAGHSPG
jgi:uncharacterized protein (DUF305 family)